MPVMHQKFQLEPDVPVKVYSVAVNEFPPHWHEACEAVYALEDGLRVSVNRDVYVLQQRDILLIGGGEVHGFPSPNAHLRRMIVQFGMPILEPLSEWFQDRRFTRFIPAERSSDASSMGTFSVHHALEEQFLTLERESVLKQEGYRMALKARLIDILLLVLRHVPLERMAPEEKARRESRLERLGPVFRYVETHHDNNISLDEIAAVANYSVFHFTRFFRECTGMTFGQYVNQYRVSLAADYLATTDEPVTEIQFRAGFGSAKTFNRVFRQIKGSSPSAYRKRCR